MGGVNFHINAVRPSDIYLFIFVCACTLSHPLASLTSSHSMMSFSVEAMVRKYHIYKGICGYCWRGISMQVQEWQQG